MIKPRLGQILTVSKIYKRQRINRRLDSDWHAFVNRKWEETNIEPTECMIIGIRMLTNGYSEWNGEQRTYEQLEWIKSLVVVKSLSSKPFNVPYSEFINSL